MKKKIKLIQFVCCLCLFACFSCSQEEEVVQKKLDDIKVVFECSKTSFSSRTKADDNVSSWKANDVVFLYQYSDKFIKCTYDGKEWKGDFNNASLDIGMGVTCMHFANPESVENYFVSLNEKSVMFCNWWSDCSFDGKTLTIKAKLYLSSRRLRFKGYKGEIVSVTGFSTYTSYYPLSNNYLTKTSGTYTLTVQSDGYTPYIYGSVESSNTLKITYSGKTYEKKITSSQLSSGESGYIVLSELKKNPQDFSVTLERNDFGSDSCIDY